MQAPMTTLMPAIRCVRIGRNTINLHNFLFDCILKTKGTDSKGEFSEVYVPKIHFNDKTTLELVFDAQEACEGARDFMEAATGATIVMPEPIGETNGKANTTTEAISQTCGAVYTRN